MKIAVLMTVHNRCRTTLRSLKHLYDNEGKEMFEVFLTDDGSTDGTTETVRMKFPNVHIIKGSGNLYWNRGMIEAWKEASKIDPEFYLWLNDDTMLHPSAVRDILQTYNEVEHMSIVSGVIVSSDMETVSYGGWINNKLVDINGQNQQVQRINGNFVLIPRCVYKKLGMLDPFFLHSFGDWEYGHRAMKNGIKLYVTPKYVGVCDRHDEIRGCFNPRNNLITRYKVLYSPFGINPIQQFYFDLKCNNIFVGVKIFVILHLKATFPFFFQNKQ